MKKLPKGTLLLLAMALLLMANMLDGKLRSAEEKRARFKEIMEAKRGGKFLNLLQIVTFPNAPCNGTTTTTGTTQKSGICYTAAECSDRSGTNTGTCASGFGVCCTFTLGCGETTQENCTYFDSSSPVAGTCSINVCPCNNNICQLRLDFSTFLITGPSTVTASQVKINEGQVTSAASAESATTRTQCLTDSFSVTNPGGNSPPVICGSNTGDHMYVDASPSCNTLAFNLGIAGTGAQVTTRSWSIKISQYSCDYPNLAPDGCIQYLYDVTGTGTVQTYNYDGGQHLANQQQVICIRQERSFCRLCVYPTTTTDFATSGIATAIGLNGDNFCCSYVQATSTASSLAKGFDCLHIPGASKTNLAGGSQNMIGSNFCGQGGLVSAVAGAFLTVCTQTTPFQLTFMSDNWEEINAASMMGEAVLANIGFMLTYFQDNTNCLQSSG